MGAVAVTVLSNGARLAIAGDEQWDDRFPTNHFNASSFSLVTYRGEVYSSYFRYDGRALTRWATNGQFRDMVANGSDLFVGGPITFPTGQRGVARWDGAAWHHLGHGVAVDGYGAFLTALEYWRGELYAGGQLSIGYSGGPRGLARFDGTNWTEVGGGLTHDQPFVAGTVWDMAVNRDILYVVGDFLHAGNVPAWSIARWDGTNWSAMSKFGMSILYRIGFRRDELFASSLWGLHKWSGSNWLTIGLAAGGDRFGQRIDALTITEDSIYIGGRFDSVDGVEATNIARWNGTNWSALGSGLTGKDWPTGHTSVTAISVWKNQVVVSGSFETAGGKPSTNFAVWHWPAPHINTTASEIEVSWWKGFTNYVLEASDTLPASNWMLVATQPNTNYYSAPASGPKKFFRLREE